MVVTRRVLIVLAILLTAGFGMLMEKMHKNALHPPQPVPTEYVDVPPE